MLLTLAVAVCLVSLCFFGHLTVMESLRWLITAKEETLRHPLPIVLVTLFVAHLLEAVIYALGLAFLDEMGRGHLMGATIGGPGWFEDHFYFSIASYTTLGLGDIIPSGDIRIVAGLESLNGLVLVSWSASFTYWVMERLWGLRSASRSR